MTPNSTDDAISTCNSDLGDRADPRPRRLHRAHFPLDHHRADIHHTAYHPFAAVLVAAAHHDDRPPDPGLPDVDPMGVDEPGRRRCLL